MATDIIVDAAQTYKINPKFLLVTLQKEQSLVVDDAPTQKQLDWATGYAVCDSCALSDPKVQKFKGFGAQVANAAGIMRWYYDNKDIKTYILKKDVPAFINQQQVIPQSWATAFLYTYTPHLHGNQNFWRIWQSWFSQVYPNGSILQTPSSTDVWLLQDGKKRRFTSRTALITRADPRLVILVPESELANYPTGPDIAFANFSILRTPSAVYLLDFDTLRPFDAASTVGVLGFNPQEIIDVSEEDLLTYQRGSVITPSSTPPQGLIWQITDVGNAYFVLRDGVLYPINDRRIIDVNFKNLSIQKHVRSDLAAYTIAGGLPIAFKDGTLVRAPESTVTYVIEDGKKRRIADKDTFTTLGYKESNVVEVKEETLFSIPEGEQLFINPNLVNSRNKFLGDIEAPVPDLFATKIPSYLVAEYPSGRIIAGKEIDSPRSLASLTKLLVAYEAFDDNFKNTALVSFSPKKFTSTNSLKLKDGEKITKLDLLHSTLIGSINNTSEMLALSTGVSKTDFLGKIRDRLANWGVQNTTITDVTGLDAKNMSTPRDLLKIFTKVTADSSLKKILGKTSYTFESNVGSKKISHSVLTTNQLNRKKNSFYTVLASKTGYTEEAQANLAMLIQSEKTQKKYVVITMGNPNIKSRFTEPNRLAEWVAEFVPNEKQASGLVKK
jgi:D-alanyl-D-alanine endopeptidase (penicillin-binding protein 7)